MSRQRTLDVDLNQVVLRLPSAYPHIGIYDVTIKKAYAAKNGAVAAIELHHAQLLRGASDESIVLKDRFICFWFHPPHTREGLVHGYPIDWTESNLLVRLDPAWSYRRQVLIPSHQTAAREANVAHQLDCAEHLMRLYRSHGLKEAISVHLIGPRATDSLFYAHRWEPRF